MNNVEINSETQMSSKQAKPDLLEALENQLSDALRTVSLIKSAWQGRHGINRQVMTSNQRIYAVFINGKGRKASESEVLAINPKDHALFLDLTRGTLGFCGSRQQLQLQTTKDAGVDGVEDILGVMMENPHLNFGNVNIGLFLPHRAAMTPDAFRKAIARIRYAIQGGDKNGPLLRHFDRSHFTISGSGHAWRISMNKGSLCVIKFLSLAGRFRRQRRW